MAFNYRRLTPKDAELVLSLYWAVAKGPRSGLARTPEEITLAYVEGWLGRAHADGLVLGAFSDGALCGEIHAIRPGAKQFAHVLGELTVAVHPASQGQGVGSQLFGALFTEAAGLNPGIQRIELIARSGNTGAIRMYERLGFVPEGRFTGRVLLADGTREDDIPMARALG